MGDPQRAEDIALTRVVALRVEDPAFGRLVILDCAEPRRDGIGPCPSPVAYTRASVIAYRLVLLTRQFFPPEVPERAEEPALACGCCALCKGLVSYIAPAKAVG